MNGNTMHNLYDSKLFGFSFLKDIARKSLQMNRIDVYYLYECKQKGGATMNLNSEIYDAIKANNNLITTSDILSMGFSRMLLSKYVKEGLLERCRQGVYTLPDETQDDMYTLMLSSKKIIFSHDTALFLNGLSDRTPFIHSLTIPSNSCLPKAIVGECNCYYVKPDFHQLGDIDMKTTFGNTVRCYDAERTVCDLLRSRTRIDEETVIAAIKNYAESKNKDLNKLSDYAKQFRVEKVLKRYLEVLL